MIAPVVRISPLTTIRRHRELPVAGEVVARKGQKVEAHHVVAEAYLQPRHLLLNIAHSLKVSPERADELVQRAAGEMVAQGDLIAGPVGLMRRVVRAPKNGRIVVAGDGKVLLQLTTIPYELRAGMPGTVVSLIPERGVVLETTGALVQGVWGNGGAEFGLLHNKLNKPDEQLTAAGLDVSLRGAIVLGGYCADAAVFQRAEDIPLRGLILTSMEASLIPAARKLSIPVVVLEGFGFHALNTIGYNVLAGADGRQVALNAQRFNRFDGSRPEVIIPLESDMPPEEQGLEGELFAVGQQVRITRDPGLGQTGEIARLLPQPWKFESGVTAPAAEVVLANERRLTVPLANLERVV